MRNLDDFKKITNYDISIYFTVFNRFIKSSFSSIQSYYQGSSVDKSVFLELQSLVDEANKIEDIISNNKQQLSKDTSFWDLIDDFEETKTRLETLTNWGKWSRSSYVYGYDNQNKSKYILKQRQNIESVADFLGSANSQDDWANIAIDNQLKEIDYSGLGGNRLDVNGQPNGQFNFVNDGVVDYMIGDDALGKDLQNKIEFINDDRVFLGVSETLYQSAGILLSVARKSVPEFSKLGYDKNIVGGNVAMILQSPIERDILNTFKTDKSFKTVQLISTNKEQDIVEYNFKIVSRNEKEISLVL